MNQSSRKGVVLMNLGSPSSTNIKDVKKYLHEFLMDKRVIDYPYLFRLLLVKGIIVPFRAPKSAEAYKSIWTKDGSPLIHLTQQLQEAIAEDVIYPVEIAMRYGSPSPDTAFESLLRKVPALEEVVVVPMYPHYAMSSYETAVEYAKQIHKKKKYDFKLTIIKPYYDNVQYIEALSESVRPYLQQSYDRILFSYHGVPERHIYKGDVTKNHCLQKDNCCTIDSVAHKQCYRHQCYTTTKLVTEQLNLGKEEFSISFQSRLGKSEWLQPYTAERLKELPRLGVKKLLVVCPAFVSDCLETLEEIAEEGKEIFLHAGGESFTIIPCLNVHPMWVKAIVSWIEDCVKGNQEMKLISEL